MSKLTKDGYLFLAKQLTAVFVNKFHGFARKISAANDFNREIIILPCYEDNSISTSKMEELYQKSVIKSKENQITERESNQRNNGCDASISQDNLKISTSMMGYLYTLIRVNQFNKKAKELQDEIISF